MDSQWLKTQFEAQPDKNKVDLARALGLEAPAISKILANKRQIKAHEYIIMRKFFGLPVDGQNTVQPHKNAVVLESLKTKAINSNKSRLREKSDDMSQEDWIMPAHVIGQRTNAPPEKIKIFQVNESRMEPHFKKGEHVVVDLTDKNPSPPGAFIISDGFGYMIRHCEFVPKSKPPRIKISAATTGFQPQTLDSSDFEIIGRAIAKLQWL